MPGEFFLLVPVLAATCWLQISIRHEMCINLLVETLCQKEINHISLSVGRTCRCVSGPVLSNVYCFMLFLAFFPPSNSQLDFVWIHSSGFFGSPSCPTPPFQSTNQLDSWSMLVGSSGYPQYPSLLGSMQRFAKELLLHHQCWPTFFRKVIHTVY